MDIFFKTGLSFVLTWLLGAVGTVITAVIIISTLINQDWSLPFPEQDWSNLWWAAVSAVSTVVAVAIGYVIILFTVTKSSDW